MHVNVVCIVSIDAFFCFFFKGPGPLLAINRWGIYVHQPLVQRFPMTSHYHAYVKIQQLHLALHVLYTTAGLDLLLRFSMPRTRSALQTTGLSVSWNYNSNCICQFDFNVVAELRSTCCT